MKDPLAGSGLTEEAIEVDEAGEHAGEGNPKG